MSKRTLLLREVVELLMWELSAISDRKWEELPELKKKKLLLADRLRKYDWTPGPEAHAPMDLIMLKSQISVQLQMIRGQINALQGQKEYWLECFNSYFRHHAPEPVPTL